MIGRPVAHEVTGGATVVPHVVIGNPVLNVQNRRGLGLQIPLSATDADMAVLRGA